MGRSFATGGAPVGFRWPQGIRLFLTATLAWSPLSPAWAESPPKAGGAAPGAASAAWAADYRLAGGDVLEIIVYGVPELSRSAAVGLDGTVAFPPLGLLAVAGLTPAGVAELVRGRLVDGQILDAPQVTAALLAARPVLVGGDVAAPGAYPFRAGLTVRGAIALAGGLGVGRDRTLDETATLRSEREVLAIDLFREEVRRARLEALLADAGDLGFSPEAAATPARAAVLALEAERLRADQAEAASEKAHLERAIALVETRIATLTEQGGIQRRLMEEQTAQVNRILEIRNRGLASEARVEEERRVFQAMQERAAANAAEIAAAQGGLEDATHAVGRFDARRRAALEAALQEATLALESLGARLRGTDARLAQLGVAAPDLLHVTVFRPGAAGEVAHPAAPETELRPGDTLEVRVALPPIGIGAGGAGVPSK